MTTGPRGPGVMTATKAMDESVDMAKFQTSTEWRNGSVVVEGDLGWDDEEAL